MKKMNSPKFGELVLQEDGEYETSVNRLFRWRLSLILTGVSATANVHFPTSLLTTCT